MDFKLGKPFTVFCIAVTAAEPQQQPGNRTLLKASACLKDIGVTDLPHLHVPNVYMSRICDTYTCLKAAHAFV